MVGFSNELPTGGGNSLPELSDLKVDEGAEGRTELIEGDPTVAAGVVLAEHCLNVPCQRMIQKESAR